MRGRGRRSRRAGRGGSTRPAGPGPNRRASATSGRGRRQSVPTSGRARTASPRTDRRRHPPLESRRGREHERVKAREPGVPSGASRSWSARRWNRRMQRALGGSRRTRARDLRRGCPAARKMPIRRTRRPEPRARSRLADDPRARRRTFPERTRTPRWPAAGSARSRAGGPRARGSSAEARRAPRCRRRTGVRVRARLRRRLVGVFRRALGALRQVSPSSDAPRGRTAHRLSASPVCRSGIEITTVPVEGQVS